MNVFIRCGRFTLVGAMGMLVQLASLALIHRFAPGHDLSAVAMAVELALLHNFVWHLHYTWSDRGEHSSLLARLVKFHLLNGFISMLGNLALMQFLVGHGHVPLLLANALVILCCSLVNFFLANGWAFALPAKPIRSAHTT